MFDVLQIIVKVAIIAGILLVAGFGVFRVWRADLDLGRLLNPKRAVQSSVEKKLSWLPTRDRDALYQDGQIVARVRGARVEESESEVRFEKVYKSNDLDLEAEFQFQKWRLRFRSADTLTMLNTAAPQEGRTITKAVCEITGDRPAI